MITITEYMDTLPRPNQAEQRTRRSAERNVQRLTNLLVHHGHTPPGGVIRLDAERWDQIGVALANMNEAQWAHIARKGNRAIPGLQEALEATITPAPVVEVALDVKPTKTRAPRAKG